MWLVRIAAASDNCYLFHKRLILLTTLLDTGALKLPVMLYAIKIYKTGSLGIATNSR